MDLRLQVTASCSGSKNFLEEALVEVRNARSGAESFTLSSDTTQLKVNWSLRSGCSDYTIPVTQVKSPTYAYGISAEIKALTAPRSNGTYAAGSSVRFQVTLKDGAGKRLHPQGSLPTYNEVIFGQNETGIQYYRAFFDPTTTYYRRKHRERMLMAQIIGPAQDIQPIRSIVELGRIPRARRRADGGQARARRRVLAVPDLPARPMISSAARMIRRTRAGPPR